MDSQQGSWIKEGPDKAIDNFLKLDILTTPKYHQDEKMAYELMRMRQDSTGMPIRRTFLGTSEQFFDAEALMAKREIEALKAKGIHKKKSSAFANVLPNIQSPRASHAQTQSSKASEQYDAYNRGKNKKKHETDMFNKSQKMTTPAENSAIRKDRTSKRNLSVGFGTGAGTDVPITSGGLEVIRDTDDPAEENSPAKIPDLKSLRASPIYEQMMNSQSLGSDIIMDPLQSPSIETVNNTFTT